MLVDTSYPIQAWNIPIGRQEKLQLWIGRVLGVHQFEIADALFRRAHLDADCASYIARRDWGCHSPKLHRHVSTWRLRRLLSPA
jgi:hypothetical protein